MTATPERPAAYLTARVAVTVLNGQVDIITAWRDDDAAARPEEWQEWVEECGQQMWDVPTGWREFTTTLPLAELEALFSTPHIEPAPNGTPQEAGDGSNA